MIDTVIALVAFTSLIFIHELGHYIVARYHRIKTNEFSLGFGPRLVVAYLQTFKDTSQNVYCFEGEISVYKLTIQYRSPTSGSRFWIHVISQLDRWLADVEFSLRLLPFLSYVQTGELRLDEVESLDDLWKAITENLVEKPRQMLTVLFAGPVANLITYIFIMVFALRCVGREDYVQNLETDDFIIEDRHEVISQLPEGIENMTVRDRVLRICDVSYCYSTARDAFTGFYYDSEEITIVYLHDEEVWRWKISSSDVGIASVGKIKTKLKTALYQAVVGFPFHLYQHLTKEWDKGEAEFSGPIGIVRETSMAFEDSKFVGWIVVASISFSLGILNLLPIPPLDGGKILGIMIRCLVPTRTPENVRRLITLAGLAISGIGTLALLASMAWLTWADVVKIIN